MSVLRHLCEEPLSFPSAQNIWRDVRYLTDWLNEGKMIWPLQALQYAFEHGAEWGPLTAGACESHRPRMTAIAFEWAHTHGCACSCGVQPLPADDEL